jgi:hypothetical protein
MGGESDLPLDDDTARRIVPVRLDPFMIADFDLVELHRALQHVGWVGREVIAQVLRQGARKGAERGVRELYERYRAEIATSNPRLRPEAANLLALAALGYVLVRPILFRKRAGPHQLYGGGMKLVRQMVHTVEDAANPPGGAVERIVEAMSRLSKVQNWIKRGLVPVRLMKKVGQRANIGSSGAVFRALRQAGIASKSQPRRINGSEERCHILTPNGQRILKMAARKRERRRRRHS